MNIMNATPSTLINTGAILTCDVRSERWVVEKLPAFAKDFAGCEKCGQRGTGSKNLKFLRTSFKCGPCLPRWFPAFKQANNERTIEWNSIGWLLAFFQSTFQLTKQTYRATKNDSANPGFGRIWLGRGKCLWNPTPMYRQFLEGEGKSKVPSPAERHWLARECPQGAFTFNFDQKGSGLCAYLT